MKKRAVWMALLMLCFALCFPALAEIPAEYASCLYPIRVNGLWGYMDYSGKTVLPPQWAYAGEFRGAGYAVVGMGKTDSSGITDRDQEGIIDRTGAYVVEPLYVCDWGEDDTYYGGRDTGIIWVYGKETLGGFFDVASGFWSGLKYGSVSAWMGGGPLIPVAAPESQAEYWESVGFADRTTGELVIPYQYGNVEEAWFRFQEGFAYVERYASPDMDDFTPLIINGRNEALPLPEGFVPEAYSAFSSGRYPVIEEETWSYGYIDTQGKLVIPAVFYYAQAFDGGLALIAADGGYGYIDRDGAVVIQPQWREAQHFSNGMAVVGDGLGRYGCIDASGKVVAPLKYSNIWEFQDNGRALAVRRVKWGTEDWYQDPDAFLWLLLDKEGREYPLPGPCEPDSLFGEGLLPVKAGGLWGYADENGALALPAQWSAAEPFANGLARVERDGKMMYIDHGGNVKWREE